VAKREFLRGAVGVVFGAGGMANAEKGKQRLPEYQGEDEVPKLLPKVAAQEKCIGGWHPNWRNTGRGAVCVEPDGCVWRRLDETVKYSTSVEKAEEIYNPIFTTYLARFLIHFEETRGTGYWRDRQSTIDLEKINPDEVNEVMHKALSEYTVSLQYGLSRYVDPKGPARLLRRLIRIYGTSPKARKQLGIMFTLLGDYQPRVFVAEVLSEFKNLRAPYEGVPKAGVALAADGKVTNPYTLVSLDMPEADILGEDGDYEERLTKENLPLLLPHWTKVKQRPDGTFFVPADLLPTTRRFLIQAPSFKTTSPISRERSLNGIIYGMFALAGMVGCSATHSVLVPIDVVKTRLQTNPDLYANLADGAKRIFREEGFRGLLLGSGPTIVGYSWYGLTVYPGYELLKRVLISLAGEINGERYHVPLVLLAGALATVVACIGVCPAEAARIRIVAQPDYAPSFAGTVRRIAKEEGVGSLFEGIGPLAIRQVLFGMMKFFIFDSFADQIFRVFPSLADRVSTQLFVSLLAGAVAGLAASVVSQPADTVLSKMKQEEGISAPEAIENLIREFGLQGLFIGLPSRCLWATPIIAGQFFLYDLFKNSFQVASDDLNLFFDVLSTPSDFIIV